MLIGEGVPICQTLRYLNIPDIAINRTKVD